MVGILQRGRCCARLELGGDHVLVFLCVPGAAADLQVGRRCQIGIRKHHDKLLIGCQWRGGAQCIDLGFNRGLGDAIPVGCQGVVGAVQLALDSHDAFTVDINGLLVFCTTAGCRDGGRAGLAATRFELEDVDVGDIIAGVIVMEVTINALAQSVRPVRGMNVIPLTVLADAVGRNAATIRAVGLDIKVTGQKRPADLLDNWQGHAQAIDEDGIDTGTDAGQCRLRYIAITQMQADRGTQVGGVDCTDIHCICGIQIAVTIEVQDNGVVVATGEVVNRHHPAVAHQVTGAADTQRIGGDHDHATVAQLWRTYNTLTGVGQVDLPANITGSIIGRAVIVDCIVGYDITH